jgi:hypothetical protein
LTTDRVRVGTRLVVSLHRRNMAEGETGMTETSMMLSTTAMHTTGSKTGVRSVSALNRSDAKRETITIMVPIMTNLTDSTLPKEGAMQEEKAFSHDLQRVHWLLNVKSLGIEKYDGSTNPAEWLEVY